MIHEGKLYCKWGSHYIELVETSKDFDDLKAENEKLKDDIKDSMINLMEYIYKQNDRHNEISAIEFINEYLNQTKQL